MERQCGVDQRQPQREVRLRRQSDGNQSLRNRGAVVHLWWRRHGAERRHLPQYLQFVRLVPAGAAVTSRSGQITLPMLDPSKGLDPSLPATLRTIFEGVYVRDQWNLSRKITASVGLRWEYYPWPKRADRGLETFDFATNRDQICGTPGANEALCNVRVQKDLFTPRVGLAYRPTDSIVIRAGFSRNPQSDNAVGRNGGTVQTFPQTISITRAARMPYSRGDVQ